MVCVAGIPRDSQIVAGVSPESHLLGRPGLWQSRSRLSPHACKVGDWQTRVRLRLEGSTDVFAMIHPS